MTHHRFFDVCTSLIDNKSYYLVTVNFVFISLIIISTKLLNHLVGELSETEKTHAIGEIQTVIVDLLFSLYMLSKNVEDKQLVRVLIPLVLRFVVFYARQRVIGLPLSPKLPTKKQHHNLITAQMSLFFISFYFTIKGIKESIVNNEQFLMVLTLQCLHGMVDCVFDIIRHIIFILDRDNFGNSQIAFRQNLMSEFVCQLIGFAADFICLALMAFSQKSLPIYLVRPLATAAKNIMESFTKQMKWRKLTHGLQNKLEDAKQDDLEHDDTCIICRLPMTLGEAKRLPCGHCLHIDCLERWIGQQEKCPICQYDLTHIVKEAEQDNQQHVHQNEAPHQEQVFVRIELQMPKREPGQDVFDFNDINEDEDDVPMEELVKQLEEKKKRMVELLEQRPK